LIASDAVKFKILERVVSLRAWIFYAFVHESKNDSTKNIVNYIFKRSLKQKGPNNNNSIIIPYKWNYYFLEDCNLPSECFKKHLKNIFYLKTNKQWCSQWCQKIGQWH